MFRVRNQKICKAVGNHRRYLGRRVSSHVRREKALFLLPLDLSRRVLRGWNETLQLWPAQTLSFLGPQWLDQWVALPVCPPGEVVCSPVTPLSLSQPTAPAPWADTRWEVGDAALQGKPRTTGGGQGVTSTEVLVTPPRRSLRPHAADVAHAGLAGGTVTRR